MSTALASATAALETMFARTWDNEASAAATAKKKECATPFTHGRAA